MNIDKEGNYEFGWSENFPAGKAIKTALEAQAALSAKLISLINTKGISDEAKDILDTAAMVCDRRSCEIETLLLQYKNLACYEEIQGSIKDMTQGNYKRHGFDLSAKTGWFH